MKKLDPRSVIIGFLVAVIGFMSLGATNSTFDSITVGNIKMQTKGLNIFTPSGRAILSLGGSENGHILRFNTSNGSLGFDLAEIDVGGVRMTFYNGHGTESVYLGQTSESDGLLVLSDRYGEAQWSMSGKRK